MLVPKSQFALRKLIVWCLVGPLHPVYILSLFFAERSLLGEIALATAVPTSLIGAVELFRLKARSYEPGELSLKIFHAMLIGIPVYSFLIGATFLVFNTPTHGIPPMRPEDIFASLFYFLAYMIIAFIYGFIPGIMTLPYASILLSAIAFKRIDDAPHMPQTGTLTAPPAS